MTVICFEHCFHYWHQTCVPSNYCKLEHNVGKLKWIAKESSLFKIAFVTHGNNIEHMNGILSPSL